MSPSFTLEEDPDFPEVFFLKAQNFLEGYDNQVEAKELLIRVLKAESDKNAPAHRWAASL